jgi:hypothetical protein
MDISVEYPFIMFIVVFETVLFLLLSSFSSQIYVEGLGTLPSYPNFTGDIINKAIQFFGYMINLFLFFFKLLILPSIPVEFRFLTVIIFAPMVIVLSWIILKAIIPLIQSLIGIIP